MPRVSVIVPNYNHLHYLPERLRSIESQSFQDFELILLDDCSSDESAIFLRQLQGEAVGQTEAGGEATEQKEAEGLSPDASARCIQGKVSQVIINQQNSGSAFKQWQKGIEAAKGELIWIAESDDSCSPLLLETLVKEFDNNPSCTLAFCASQRIFSDGSPLGLHPYQQRIGKDLRLNGNHFINEYLLKKNYVVNASGALFLKSAAQKVGDAHLNYKGVGDWLFWTKIAMQGDVAFVNKPFNFFRQHGSNTTSGLKSSGEALLELKRLQEDFMQLGFSNKKVFFSNRVFAVHSVRYGKVTEPLRSKILQAWEDNIFVSFCALLKQLKKFLTV